MSIVKSGNFMRQFRDDVSKEMRQISSFEFMEIWNHYDKDKNGYLEGKELDLFLRELCTSVSKIESCSEIIPDSVFDEFKESILDAYDENQDGKLSVQELAEILPTEESFLLLFRMENYLDSCGDFMKIWIEFDKDGSGFIEVNELRDFISKLLDRSKNKINDEKLNEYTYSILNIFDTNQDGRLQLSEMIKLLTEKENRSLKNILETCKSISNEDLDNIFKIYDMNRNEVIEGSEINKLAKDLLELTHMDYTYEDWRTFKNGLLAAADTNKDGKICKSEFKIILMALTSKSNSSN